MLLKKIKIKKKNKTLIKYRASQWLSDKESACNGGDTRDTGSIPGSERSPGGRNGNHLGIPAWKIPRTEEPGGPQTIGS